MTPVRFAARTLLGYTFVRGGYAALRDPAESADAVRPLVERLSTQFPSIPKNPATVVRATGAVQILAGTALALGRAPRLSALLLAGSLVPAGGILPHKSGDATPETKARQRAEFEKNLAVLGGLVLAAVDTQGRPSISWRARRAAKDARKATERTAKSARRSTEYAAKIAREKLPG